MSSFGDGNPSTQIEQELKWIAEDAQKKGITERDFYVCMMEAIKYFLETHVPYIWEKEK